MIDTGTITPSTQPFGRRGDTVDPLERERDAKLLIAWAGKTPCYWGADSPVVLLVEGVNGASLSLWRVCSLLDFNFAMAAAAVRLIRGARQIIGELRPTEATSYRQIQSG